MRVAWQLEEGLSYLARRDARMAAAIEELGGIYRTGGEPVFTGQL